MIHKKKNVHFSILKITGYGPTDRRTDRPLECLEAVTFSLLPLPLPLPALKNKLLPLPLPLFKSQLLPLPLPCFKNLLLPLPLPLPLFHNHSLLLPPKL